MDTFAGPITSRKKSKTVAGIWQRPKRGRRKDGTTGNTGKLQLLVRFDADGTVEARFRFGETANTAFQRHFGDNAIKAIDHAVKTARR